MENPLVVDHFPWESHGKPMALSPWRLRKKNWSFKKPWRSSNARHRGHNGVFWSHDFEYLHSDVGFKRFGC